MNENKKLVPSCIIYQDGKRLSIGHEGALKAVKVADRLNGISVFSLLFDGDEYCKAGEVFEPYSNISIHLGYKDNINEVYNGQMLTIEMSSHGASQSEYKLSGASYLLDLNRGKKTRSFGSKSPSQIVQSILEEYGLQGEVESFGLVYEEQDMINQSNYNFVQSYAARYGKELYAFGKKVYVKEQIRQKQEDIIYEWGKSLLRFDYRENAQRQITEACVFGYDVVNNQEVRETVRINDVTQKTGGKTDWTKVSKGTEYIEYQYENGIRSKGEARELALAALRNRSFEFIKLEGAVEGDSRLRPGMVVEIKGLSESHCGEYIAEWVVHEYSAENGYTTEFGLKRNMLADSARHKPMPAGNQIPAGGGTKARQADSGAAQDEDTGQKKNPAFSSLQWQDNTGKAISEALVDDEVTLAFDVQDIDNGKRVNVGIWEHDDDGEHDYVENLTGTVRNGKVAIVWNVIYTEDADDTDSAKELEEKSCTLPEYHFVAEYGGAESEESPILKILDKFGKQIFIKGTRIPLANTGYTLIFPDGTRKQGTTDENGFIHESSILLSTNVEILFNED